jgi:chromate transporter
MHSPKYESPRHASPEHDQTLQVSGSSANLTGEKPVPNRVIGLSELFRGFATIGLLGFGGVAAAAHHVIVERYQWLTDKEYATVLGIGQVLPGANTVNAAVMIGDRYQGVKGSVVCVLGIMLLPIIILVGLATLYNQFAQIPAVNDALTGAAAAAAGLVIGTGLKMARRLKPGLVAGLIILLVLAGVAGMHWPMIQVIPVLVPLALLLTFAWDKK